MLVEVREDPVADARIGDVHDRRRHPGARRSRLPARAAEPAHGLVQDVPERDQHVLGDGLQPSDPLHGVGRERVRERRQHVGRLARRHVREHDRDRLRMLVDEYSRERRRRDGFEARRE